MRKLLLFILLIPAWVQAQNYSPTAPVGSSPQTLTFRSKITTPDSTSQIWAYMNGHYFGIPTSVGLYGAYLRKADSTAYQTYTGLFPRTDTRYYTKTLADARYARLAATNTFTGGFQQFYYLTSVAGSSPFSNISNYGFTTYKGDGSTSLTIDGLSNVVSWGNSGFQGTIKFTTLTAPRPVFFANNGGTVALTGSTNPLNASIDFGTGTAKAALLNISSAPTNRTDLTTGSVLQRNTTTGNLETVSGSYFAKASDLGNYVDLTTAQSVFGEKTWLDRAIMSPTLTSTANNQELDAVIINPIVTNTAFTGTQNVGLLINANTVAPTPISITSERNTALLRINGADGLRPRIYMDGYGNNTGYPTIVMRSAGGTNVSPTNMLSGNVIGQLTVAGYGTTGYGLSTLPFIRVDAAQDFDDNSNGMKTRMFTRANNTNNSFIEAARFDQNGNVAIGPYDSPSRFSVYQDGNGVGTITTTVAGTTVTGVNTTFTTTFAIGQSITANGETRAIAAIASNTSMTTAAWTNANANVAYTLSSKVVLSANGNGNVGINSTTPGYSTNSAGRSFLTIEGTSAAGGVELATKATNADNTIVGLYSFIDKSNVTDADKKIAYINGYLSGGTNNRRGGYMILGVRPNNATTGTERLRVDTTGIKVTGVANVSSLTPNKGVFTNALNDLISGDVLIPSDSSYLASKAYGNNQWVTRTGTQTLFTNGAITGRKAFSNIIDFTYTPAAASSGIITGVGFSNDLSNLSGSARFFSTQYTLTGSPTTTNTIAFANYVDNTTGGPGLVARLWKSGAGAFVGGVSAGGVSEPTTGYMLDIGGKARITQMDAGTAGTDSIMVHDNTLKGVRLIAPNYYASTGNANTWTGVQTFDANTIYLTGRANSVYNTADITTNTEYFKTQWQSNILTLGSYMAGSASARSIAFGIQPSAGTTVLTGGRVFQINNIQAVAAGIYDFQSTTASTGNTVTFNTGLTSSSNSQSMVSIQGTVAQSGTASYTAASIYPYEQSTGSGATLLIGAGTRSAAAGGTLTTKFSVDNTGKINSASLTGSRAVFTNSTNDLVSNTISGTGSVAMTNSPAFTGTPTNATPGTLAGAPTGIPNNTTMAGAISGYGANTYRITANRTFTSADFLGGYNSVIDIYVDDTLGNVTVTIPSAGAMPGTTWYVTKTNISVNTVTIASASTINGGTTLTTQFQGRQLMTSALSVGDGSAQWFNH